MHDRYRKVGGGPIACHVVSVKNGGGYVKRRAGGDDTTAQLAQHTIKQSICL